MRACVRSVCVHMLSVCVYVLCVSVHVCMCVCMCLCVHVVCVCMYVHMCVVCVYVCMHVHTLVYVITQLLCQHDELVMSPQGSCSTRSCQLFNNNHLLINCQLHHKHAKPFNILICHDARLKQQWSRSHARYVENLEGHMMLYKQLLKL